MAELRATRGLEMAGKVFSTWSSTGKNTFSGRLIIRSELLYRLYAREHCLPQLRVYP